MCYLPPPFMRLSVTAKMKKYKYNYSSMNQGEQRGLKLNWNEWIYGIERNFAESDFLEQNWLIHRIIQGKVTQWLSSWSRWHPLPAYHHLNNEHSPLPVKMCLCWLPQTDSCFDLFCTLWMFYWRAVLVLNSHAGAEQLLIHDVFFSFKFAIWDIN